MMMHVNKKSKYSNKIKSKLPFPIVPEFYPQQEPVYQNYCVEKILGKRIIGDDKVEYLLKWENWPDEFNNWEPQEHLNCPALIAEFELENSKIHSLQEDNRFRGFERGVRIEKIIGATKHNGVLMFLVKWKHCWDVDLLPAEEVNRKAHKAVIRYYENKKPWSGGPIVIDE